MKWGNIKINANILNISSVEWSQDKRNGIISNMKKHEIKYKNFVGLSFIILK